MSGIEALGVSLISMSIVFCGLIMLMIILRLFPLVFRIKSESKAEVKKLLAAGTEVPGVALVQDDSCSLR